MLKTSESIESLTRPEKGGVGFDGDSKTRRDNSKLDESGIGDNKVDNEIRKKGWNLTKSKNLSKSKKTELGFLTSGARRVFTELGQAFIKAPIPHHFDSERHIRVETDASGYAIGRVLS